VSIKLRSKLFFLLFFSVLINFSMILLVNCEKIMVLDLFMNQNLKMLNWSSCEG
jgi:hypothetical protein